MENIELDPSSTALVLIDLQRGIVAGPTEPRPSSEIVAECAKLAERFRAARATVVYVHVNLADMIDLPVDQPMRPPGTPPPGPEMTEIVPEAGYRASAGDLLVLKRSWGAFGGTDLEDLLHDRGVRTIVLGGISTNLGVESTARAAQGLGFATVFVADAMGTRSEQMQDFALEKIFPRLGRVRNAGELRFAAKR